MIQRITDLYDELDDLLWWCHDQIRFSRGTLWEIDERRRHVLFDLEDLAIAVAVEAGVY